MEWGLEELISLARRYLGWGKAEIDRQHRCGHLTVRERIDRLLTPATF